jgi:hypothetical protein
VRGHSSDNDGMNRECGARLDVTGGCDIFLRPILARRKLPRTSRGTTREVNPERFAIGVAHALQKAQNMGYRPCRETGRLLALCPNRAMGN